MKKYPMTILVFIVAFTSGCVTTRGSEKQEPSSTTKIKDYLPYDKSSYFPTPEEQFHSLPIAYSHTKKDNDECANSMLTKGANTTTKLVKEPTEDKEIFYDSKPLIKISGISSVKLNGEDITIKLKKFGFHKEYKAPVINTIQETHYEARPGTAAVVQTLTLGLSFIFAPKMSAMQAFGCTDRKLVDRSIDISNKQFTGKYMRKSIPLNENNIFISDSDGKEIRIDQSDFKEEEDDLKAMTVSLSEYIKTSNISNSTKIIINCSTCLEMSEVDRVDWKLLESPQVIVANFNEYKNKYNEIERVQTERLAEEERNRIELVRQKADEDERIRLESAKQKMEEEERNQRLIAQKEAVEKERKKKEFMLKQQEQEKNRILEEKNRRKQQILNM